MANLPQTKKAFVRAGVATTVVGGVSRYGVAAGLLSGGFGRPGDNYPDLTTREHIDFVLGFSGQPSEMRRNVAKLRRLLNPGAGPFGDYLERMVNRLARMTSEDREALKDHWMRTEASLLLDPAEGVARISFIQQGEADFELSHEPPVADRPIEIEFRDPDKRQDLDAFLEGPHRGVLVWRRQPTEISLVVLIVVAELLTERVGQHGDPPPTEKEGAETSQPENEAASDLPGSEARFDYSNYSTDQLLTAARPLHTLEDSGGKEEYQAFPFGGRSPETKGDLSHGLHAG